MKAQTNISREQKIVSFNSKSYKWFFKKGLGNNNDLGVIECDVGDIY